MACRLANFDLYIQGKSEEESKHLTNYSTDLLRRDCTWNYVQYLKGYAIQSDLLSSW